MSCEFFDPTPEKQNVILIDAATLRKAERMIESCEHCNPTAQRFRLTGFWIALQAPIRA